MRHTITQEDGMGCGAACVAFALGLDYIQAANFLGRQKARTTGFNLKELADVLNSDNNLYRGRHINSVSKNDLYREGSIVFIKRSKRYPYGHYLIRYNQLWMDPWINLPHDKDIAKARSGYRRRLPGKAQWLIFKVS